MVGSCAGRSPLHGYLGIDLEIAWRVTVKQVPELREQIAEILTQEFGG